MKIGLIGLGRMGAGIAGRLLNGGHEVAAFDADPAVTERLGALGVIGTRSLEKLAEELPVPRAVWLMLPCGDTVERTVETLRELLSPGDVVVDGGNSFYGDDIRRAEMLKDRGILYVDAGVSGGIRGRDIGYAIMVGGEKGAVDIIAPAFNTLAASGGWVWCGPAGAGHYVKMVHNGIEYALMEAYGEGLELLKESPFGGSIDLERVIDVWNGGSVIRSWLLELAGDALKNNPGLDTIEGRVDDTGAGRWTVEEAVRNGVSASVIAEAVFKRFRSRKNDVFSDRVIAALRREFGGHAVTFRNGRSDDVP